VDAAFRRGVELKISVHSPSLALFEAALSAFFTSWDGCLGLGRRCKGGHVLRAGASWRSV